MFGVPEWAIGVGVIITAVFAGIGLMVRIFPPKMRHPRLQGQSEDQQGRIEDLERRLGETEGLRSRVAEIEERLDFTERLLTRHQDAERLAPPRS